MAARWLTQLRRFWSAYEGCSRTSARPHGCINNNEKEDEYSKKKMTEREQYTPSPNYRAQVRKGLGTKR